MPLPPKTWVEVSRSALRHNAASLRKMLAPGSALMVVVKSNAYGHGTAQTVGALKGHVGWFGVDSVPEADIVHKANPAAKILVLGLSLPAWIPHAASRGYRLSVSSPAAIRTVTASKKPLKIHLEVETGLQRQGIGERELPAAIRLLGRNKKICVEGMFTHFANIEDTTDHDFAELQLRRFKKMLSVGERLLKHPIEVPHTACSAAGILFPETHFALVRAGIALYGYWPSPETKVSARHASRVPQLRQALAWKTIIAQVKPVAAGTPISYGLTERMRRSGRIAVLPVGYWDGYDRGLSSVSEVLIRGQRAKIIGRVCMNMCMADVSHIRGAKAGDVATLISADGQSGVDADFIAKKTNTINYEVLTRINPQITRVLKT